ncbi:MAG: hypothetical protein ABIT76_15280 [Chthoniobacterales bacterium]
MSPFALLLVLQILASIILLILGAVRSGLGTAFISVIVAATLLGVCHKIGQIIPRFSGALFVVAIGLSALALCIGFIKVKAVATPIAGPTA